MAETLTIEAQTLARRDGEAALKALNHCLDENGEDRERKLAEAVQVLVRLRDDLIRLQREGTPCGDWLPRINALISSVLGVEFPIAGVQMKRVCGTRDALQRMLGGDDR